jgi:hypothetical protein
MTDNADPPPASRFATWFLIAAFNTIALVALNSELEYDLKDESRPHNWCISSMIVTLTLAALGVFAHLLRGKFVGAAFFSLIWIGLGSKLPAIVEVILCRLMLVAWVFAAIYVTFGDDEDVPAQNVGNLYFAT